MIAQYQPTAIEPLKLVKSVSAHNYNIWAHKTMNRIRAAGIEAELIFIFIFIFVGR